MIGTISVAQYRLDLQNGTPPSGPVTLLDSVQDIQSLTQSEIESLPAYNVTGVTVQTATVLFLLVPQAIGFLTAGVPISGAAIIDIEDTGSEIASLLPSQIQQLTFVQGYEATTALTFTICQALAIGSTSTQTTFGQPVLIQGSVADFTGLTANQLDQLTVVGNVLSVVDKAANIEQLSAAEINSLGRFAIFTATDGSVALTAMQLQALNDLGDKVIVPAGDTITMMDIGANIVFSSYVSSYTSTSGSVSLDAADALEIASQGQTISVPSGDTVTAAIDAGTIELSVTNIEYLSAFVSTFTIPPGIYLDFDKALALVQSGATLSVSGGGTVGAITGTIADFQSLTAPELAAFIALTGPQGGIVSDTTNDIEALTVGEIVLLPYVGTYMSDDGGLPTLNAAQYTALQNNGAVINTQGSQFTVTATAAFVEGLSLSPTPGPTAQTDVNFQVTDGSVDLTVAQALALLAYGDTVSVPTGDTVGIVDSGQTILNLKPSQISQLTFVSSYTSTSNLFLDFFVPQASAFEQAGATVHVPPGLKAYFAASVSDFPSLTASEMKGFEGVGLYPMVLDLAMTIKTLTPAQIRQFGQVTFNASDDSLVFNAAQAAALGDENDSFFVPNGDSVTIQDTAANIGTLTPGEIQGLGQNVRYDSTDTTLTFNVDQAEAFVAVADSTIPPDLGTIFTVPKGDSVAIEDSSANVYSLNAAQLQVLNSLGVTSIGTSGTVSQITAADYLSNFAGRTIQPPAGDGSYEIADIAANIQSLLQIPLSELHTADVYRIAATDGTVQFTVDQALALINSPVSITSPGDIELVGTAASLEALTPAELAELVSMGFTQVLASDTLPVFSAAQMEALGQETTYTGGQNAAAVGVTADNPDQNDGFSGVTGTAGLNFDITWDPSVASAPAGYKAEVLAAFQYYADTFSTGVTLTLNYDVGFGEQNGAALGTGALGESYEDRVPVTYTEYVAALSGRGGQSSVQQQAYASLPTNSPYGNDQLLLTFPEALMLGLAPEPAADYTGYVGFTDLGDLSYDATPDQAPGSNLYDLFASAEHEISEVMGRVTALNTDGPGGSTTNYSPPDLYRFSAANTLATTPASNPSYFSIDDGTTPIAYWNNTSIAGGDLDDWAENNNPPGSNTYTPDSYNDGSNPVVNPITPADIAVLNTLGYDLAQPTADPTLYSPYDRLFFDGDDANGHNALWVSTGTAGGTHELAGVDGITGDLLHPADVVRADGITQLGNQIVFAGTDLYGNDGLWVSDGTASGTFQLAGIANAFAAGLNPYDLTVVGNKIWFEGTDSTGHIGLWETDGTTAGTQEIVPDLYIPVGNAVAAYDNGIVFDGSDGGLWQSDGTVPGTTEVDAGLQPYAFDDFEGTLLFGGAAENTDAEGTYATDALYSYDGSVTELSLISPGAAEEPPPDAPPGEVAGSTPGGSIVNYTVQTIATDNGAQLISTPEAVYQGDFEPGTGGGLVGYNPLTNTITEIDGQPEGLTINGSTPGGPDPTDIITADGLLLFNIDGEIGLSAGIPNGEEVTPGNSTLVYDDNFALSANIQGASTTGYGLDPEELTAFEGNVYFQGVDAAGNVGLWELASSDGTLITSVTSTQGLTGPAIEASGFELADIAGAGAQGLSPEDLTAETFAAPAAIPITAGQLLEYLIEPAANTAPSGSAYIVTDTAFDIESLTSGDIAAGEAIGLQGVYVTDTSLVLTADQAAAFCDVSQIQVPYGELSIEDTASNIGALNSAQLTALVSLGLSQITVTDASLALNTAQAVSLEGSVSISVPPGDSVSISDDGSNISTLTPTQIDGLASLGIHTIDATTAVLLSTADSQALEQNSITLVLQNGATLTTQNFYTAFAAEIEAATASELASVAAGGYTGVEATDASVVLTVAEAALYENAGLMIEPPTGGTVTIADTAHDIEGMSAPEIAGLPAIGVTGIAATNLSVALSAAQAAAFAGAELPVGVPSGDTVTVRDIAANIELLTPLQLGFIAGSGATAIIATDTDLRLTALQAVALEAAGVTVSAPSTFDLKFDQRLSIGILDSAANIELLTPTEIGGLPNLGIDVVVANDASVALSVAQAEAYHSAGVGVFAPNGGVSISDIAAHIESGIATLAQEIIAGQPPFFRAQFAATDGSVTLTATEAQYLASDALGFYFTVPAGDTVTVSDTAANIFSLLNYFVTFPGYLQELSLIRVTGFDATTGPVQLSAGMAEMLETSNADYGASFTVSAPAGSVVELADSPGNIAAMTPTQLAGLPGIGVSVIAAGGSLQLTVAQAVVLETTPATLEVPSGDTISIYDMAQAIEDLTVAQITGLRSIGVTAITAYDTSVTVNEAQTVALENAPLPIQVPPGNTVTLADSETGIDQLTATEANALTAVGVTLVSVPNLTQAGPVYIGGGVDFTVGGAVALGSEIDFAGQGGSLTLPDEPDMAGTILGFAAGDTIDLANIGYDPSANPPQLETGNVLDFSEYGTEYDLQLDPNQYFLSENFVLGPDLGDGTDITLVQVPITSDVVIPPAATVDGVTVAAGGSVEVEPGGALSGGAVSSGGSLVVDDGAMASGVTVSDGGYQYVSAGGIANDTVLTDPGSQVVYAGGSANNTVVSGGYQDVFGTATVTLVEAGGSQVVEYGGSAAYTTISDTGSETVYGTDDYAVVCNGGQQTITFGGTASGTTIDSGGDQYAAAYAVVSGATVSGVGAVQEVAGSASNTTVAGGGILEIDNGGSAVSATAGPDGTITVFFGGTISSPVIAGGLLDVQSGGSVADNILFGPDGGGAAGTLELDGALPPGDLLAGVALSGFSPSDTIDLAGIGDDSTGTANLVGDQLQITESGTLYDLTLSGIPVGDYFHLAADAGSGTDITEDQTACYCRGTLILAARGEVPVEDLAIGDRVVTVSGEAKAIRWIGHRSYAGWLLAGNRDVLPIRIAAGALDDAVPVRDLWVSPEHALYLDEALVPARHLVNGVSIVQVEEVVSVEYFHIELEAHDVIFAEGAAAESFVDDGSRMIFHNAAEFFARHPRETVRVPALYCAPRLEAGFALDALHRRLAGRSQRLGADGVAAPSRLQGHLDLARHDLIEGWAFDPERPDAALTVVVLTNGAEIARIVADRYRADLEAAEIGDGCHAFSFAIPGVLTTDRLLRVELRHASDWTPLEASPADLQPVGAGAAAPLGVLRGELDVASHERIAGWAQDAADAERAVGLVITVNGQIIGRVLANQHRADLAVAGLGSGRHAFELVLPGTLSALEDQEIRVTREADGAELPGSPAIRPAAHAFDKSMQQALGGLLAGIAPGHDEDTALAFLTLETDRLLARRAARESSAAAREALRLYRRRWGGAAPQEAPPPGLRALVIDTLVPVGNRDAGSVAVLSHMRALQALGYQVSFVAAHEIANSGGSGPLAAEGITLCATPHYSCVEDVLCRQAGTLDLVYLHRGTNADNYLTLARRHQPKARIVFSVADLHHLRLARQAKIEARPELLVQSRRIAASEMLAAHRADIVITHSPVEAALLRREVNPAKVHVVPFAVAPGTARPPFAERRGIAFIGSFEHRPNPDAVHHLLHDILPLVWQKDPALACKTVGHGWREDWLPGRDRRVTIAGAVDDLDAVFDKVRLTVAPLRFGAGIKGKVLDSFAAGLPCVMTPIAAEGLALPPSLQPLIADDPAALADLILRYHADPAANEAAANAAVRLVAEQFTQDRVTQTLLDALDGCLPIRLDNAARPGHRRS